MGDEHIYEYIYEYICMTKYVCIYMSEYVSMHKHEYIYIQKEMQRASVGARAKMLECCVLA